MQCTGEHCAWSSVFIIVTRSQNSFSFYGIIKTQKGKTPEKHKRKEYIMSLVKINKDNFEQIKNSDKKVLIDFYADWCGPCRMVSPIIDEIANERDDIVVGKVNVDNEQELASAFGVFSIPTLVVLEGGKVVKQVSGARPKAAILALVDQ